MNPLMNTESNQWSVIDCKDDNATKLVGFNKIHCNHHHPANPVSSQRRSCLCHAGVAELKLIHEKHYEFAENAVAIPPVREQ
jgi:hypothetical protein